MVTFPNDEPCDEPEDLFDNGSEDIFLPDEQELKRKVAKLERKIIRMSEEHRRDMKKLEKFHQFQLANQEKVHQLHSASLGEQIRELLEKNWELKETSNIFVKGLQHLKQDGIRVTTPHIWDRRGMHGSLENRIKQLAMDGKRIVSICPLRVTHQGDTIEAIIVTEHFKREK